MTIHILLSWEMAYYLALRKTTIVTIFIHILISFCPLCNICTVINIMINIWTKDDAKRFSPKAIIVHNH
jgi:hypothetical protein